MKYFKDFQDIFKRYSPRGAVPPFKDLKELQKDVQDALRIGVDANSIFVAFPFFKSITVKTASLVPFGQSMNQCCTKISSLS